MYTLKVVRNLVISAFKSVEDGIHSLAEDSENSKQAGLGYLNQAISLISTARVIYYLDKELLDRYYFDTLFIAFDEIISSSLKSHREITLQQMPLSLIEEKLKPLYERFKNETTNENKKED